MSKSYVSEQENYERGTGVYAYARSFSDGTPAPDAPNSARRPVKAPALPSASYRPKTSVYNAGALPSGAVNVYDTPEEPAISGKKPDFQTNRIVCYRSATVCLAVTCLLLLAAIIGLGVKYSLDDRWYSTEVAALQSEGAKFQYERDVLLNISAQELGWTRFGSSIYFLPTYYNLSTWQISRQDCVNRKADLVMINSKQELVRRIGSTGSVITKLQGVPFQLPDGHSLLDRSGVHVVRQGVEMGGRNLGESHILVQPQRDRKPSLDVRHAEPHLSGGGQLDRGGL